MSRILVVDDSQENRYLLEVLLKGHGHEVVAAREGSEAIAAALAQPPDLVVTDILMPGMDGFAFCMEWKKNERLKGIPLIIYTATYTDRRDEELAYRLGADRFVIKPQEPEAILEIVQEGLRGSFGKARGSGARDERGGEPEAPREYTGALVRKLEKKVADLETAKQALERTIAERMRTEEALRESETKYRIVADNTFNWEYWLDPAERFVYSSPSCLGITGHSREEFLATPHLLEDLLHPDDLAVYRAHRAEAEAGKAGGDVNFRILHKDGTVRWIAHDCTPVFDERGGFMGTRGSNRDITRKRQLEDQLRHAQRLEAVGLLAGGIAREFNGLLAAIIGSSAVIQRKTGANDPLRESMDQMLAATQSAAALTKSLLAFSRKQELRLLPLDLAGLVRALEMPLRRMMGKEIRVEFAHSVVALPVTGDRAQLEQVLVNLAANARDAMPAGGTLRVSTGLAEVDGEFIERRGLGKPGTYALLAVRDDGVGMSADVQTKVFEPFFTTKGSGMRTGLGLSVAHGIVSQHGGFITVGSEPGKGSVFSVFIPLAGGGKEEGR